MADLARSEVDRAPSPAPVGAIRFPGLNGLRFIAAQAVVLAHSEAVLYSFGFYDAGFWLNAATGKIAVILFFVLSGFLITYLLLAERARTGTIDVRAFYLRRILRIWPLYYLVVLGAFLVLPHLDVLATSRRPSGGNLFLYLTILPNFADPFPYAGHLWSIGVEEQFYLVWPLLLRATRRPTTTLLVLIASYLAVLGALMALDLEGIRWAARALEVVGLLRFDCMAIGGLGALVVIEKREAILRLLSSNWTRVGALAGFVLLYLLHARPNWFTYDAYAVIFLVLILNVCSNPSSVLETRPLDWLGKISYGIYMYHPVTIVLSVRMFIAVHGVREVNLLQTIFIYGFITSVTIFTAALSYYGFELRFLRQKLKVSTILSGDFATPSGKVEAPAS